MLKTSHYWLLAFSLRAKSLLSVWFLLPSERPGFLLVSFYWSLCNWNSDISGRHVKDVAVTFHALSSASCLPFDCGDLWLLDLCFSLCMFCGFLSIRCCNSWIDPPMSISLFTGIFPLKILFACLFHIVEIFLSLSLSSYNLFTTSAIMFPLLTTFPYCQTLLFWEACSWFAESVSS